MTLLWAEGFDGLDDWASEAQMYDGATSANISYDTGYGRRTGSKGLASAINNTEYFVKNLLVNRDTLIVGFAVRRNVDSIIVVGNSASSLLSIRYNTTNVFSLPFTAGGVFTLTAKRGAYNGTALGTTSQALPLSSWVYVEVKVKAHASDGTVDVWFNGTNVLSLTGQNTDGAGSALMNNIVVYVTGASANFGFYTCIDDVYVVDTQGSINNDRLGDVRIDSYVPTSDGTYSDFTRSAGSNNYSLIDEVLPSDTDHLVGDAVDEKFSTKFTAVDTGYAIVGVVSSCITNNPEGGGTRKVKPFIKSGSTELLGDEVTLGTTYSRCHQTIELDPNDSSALTVTKINNMEFGLKVTV